ncbi:hypothetical protein [Rhizobium oryzicola]|uniref:Uncharacterized protein n=1 Tax=Rhizobium oryzicola TaxID=1232668 RepID=A0ABT8T0Q9_9HYPH|nr:hypothetical protein [Rhizobium oryzicola]MDO1584340.1 hypothetical protein [Rhizobium oryzicola]
MTIMQPSPEEESPFFLRHVMEVSGAPSLQCGNRACRRYHRCVGIFADDHLPCEHGKPFGGSAAAARISRLALNLIEATVRGTPAEGMAEADPTEREMAIRLVRMISPKRYWRRINRTLLRSGARKPHPRKMGVENFRR